MSGRRGSRKQVARSLLQTTCLRVLPTTVLVLAGVWYFATLSVDRTVVREVETRLTQQAGAKALALSQKLRGLVDAANAIAENELLGNSLVDKVERQHYLGPFFATLRLPGQERPRITMTDYRGRTIRSTDANLADVYQGEAWFQDVMVGNSHVSVSAERIVIAHPIRLSGGLPEGTLIVDYSPTQVAEVLGVRADADVTLLVEVDGKAVHSSKRGLVESPAADLAAGSSARFRMTAVVPTYPRVSVLLIQTEESALASTRRLRTFLWWAMAVDFVALVAGILLTARHATKPLASFVKQVRSVDPQEPGSRRIVLSGPSEFHQLGDSFNSMLSRLECANHAQVAAEKRLQQANRDLDAKVAKRTAELEAVIEDLSQFTYLASHDLQEPLRKLISFSQLLREDAGDLNEVALNDLGFIIDASKRMQNLVQDLLRLSRASARTLSPRVLALDDCVDEALQGLQARILEAGGELERDRLPEVRADQTLVTELYRHLLDNTLKFRREDQPLRIRLTVQSEPHGPILGVLDNGIGIPAEFAEQVFGPFKRLHGRHDYGGTGIGLAICRKAVERHNGSIWAEPAPGGGVHMRFTLHTVPAGAVGAQPCRAGESSPALT